MQQQAADQSNPYALLKNRNFMLYMMGRVITVFGSQMLTVGLMWDIYERTNSSLALGFVGLSEFLPMIFATIPAGHLADRYDRRKMILIFQAVI